MKRIGKSVKTLRVTISHPNMICINCGFRGAVTREGEVFKCATCKYVWSDYHEQTQFQCMQRGEK